MSRPAVLVIRGEDLFSDRLREAGIEARNLELIKTQPVADLRDLRKTFGRLSEYDGLFLTSPAAAEVFVEQLPASNNFTGSIYVLGERAKKVLQWAGFDCKYRDSANTAEELISSFENSEFDGKRFLFIRGDKSMRAIPDLLDGKATVDEIIVYETKAVQPDESEIADLNTRLQNGDIGWICFFSPSGVERFRTIFGNSARASVAAIGATTARKAEGCGFSVKFISDRSNAENFAKGLIEHIRRTGIVVNE